jgi:hypothetical protein
MYFEMFRVCCDALLGKTQRQSFAGYACWNLAKHLELAELECGEGSSKEKIEEFLLKMTTDEACIIITRIELAATIDFNNSQLAEAEKLLLGAKIFAERKLGADHIVTLNILLEIAKVYERHEKFGEAAKLFLKRAEILKEKESRFEDSVDDLIAAARSYEFLNPPEHFGQAEKLWFEALNPPADVAFDRKDYKLTFRYWKCYVALACNLEVQGRIEDAKKKIRECELALEENASLDQNFAIEEEITLFKERNGGEKDATLGAFTRMWQQEKKRSGIDSQQSLVRKWYVAYLEMEDEANFSRSDKLWEEIIEWKRRTDGSEFTSSMAALVKSWAWVCKKHQRWGKAERIAEKALQIAEKSYLPGSYGMAGHYLILADISRAKGRDDAASGRMDKARELMKVAIEYYEKGVDIHRNVLGEQHPWTLDHEKVLEEMKDGKDLKVPGERSIHPYVSRDKRTRREWRSVKNSAEREIYDRV